MNTTTTPTIDKYTAALTIRQLMQLWGLDWNELKRLTAAAAPKPTEEWRTKVLELEGFLKEKNYPEFADPVAYARTLRDRELEDNRGYKHLLPHARNNV